MANYDAPGVLFDSGAFYNAISLPQPIKRMAIIKMNFRGLPDLGIIQQCTNIKTALTGNATFPTPTPTLPNFTALITAAQTKLTAADTAAQTAKLATADKDNAIAALLAGVNQLADYVSMISAGDGVKIQSAGFGVKAANTPAVTPGQVVNLAITAGDNAGELDLQWDPVSGTKTYEVQTSPDPMTATSWTGRGSVSKSKMAVLDLTSGARAWARVRATNSAGTGAWSDPGTKIVP